jgi:hypothetical protein
VWRGIGIKAIDANKSPEERTKTVDEAVEKILGEYPPNKKDLNNLFVSRP